MGIFSYTESIMYVYMKYKGHSFHNVCPICFMYVYKSDTNIQRKRIVRYSYFFNRPSMVYGPRFLHMLLKSTKKIERHSQIIILAPVQNAPKGNLPTSITPKMVKFMKKNYHVFSFIVTYDIRENEKNW